MEDVKVLNTQCPVDLTDLMNVPPEAKSATPEERTAVVEPKPVVDLGDPRKQRSLLRQLTMYKQKFPEATKNIDHSVWGFMSVPELEAELEEIKLTVNGYNSSDLFKTMYIGGISLGEQMLSAIGIPATEPQRVSTILASSPAINAALDELMIEQGEKLYMSPMKRLIIGTLATAGLVIKHNMSVQKPEEKKEAPKSTESSIKEKYSDL